MQRALSQRLLEQERELTASDAQLAVTARRAVDRGLHELAEEPEADLLVVGRARHRLLGRVLVGDSRATLSGAFLRDRDRPARVRLGLTSRPARRRRLRRLTRERTSLSAAQELANPHAAHITLMWVISPEDVRNEKRPSPRTGRARPRT
jgi:hypothetical protein